MATITLGYGQGVPCNSRITVKVFDADSKSPLTGATISLQGRPTSVSNTGGELVINQLCEGTLYTLRISYIGYKPLELSFNAKNGAVLEVMMKTDAIGLATIVIQGQSEAAPTRPSEQLSGDDLSRTRGKTLAESLKNLPGLNSLQTGPGISKPVIQGLHSNRILILNNGIRLEGQQWGAEHAPEIDPFIANKITVIKGAEGVKYGPDAIGGVIILEPEELNYSEPIKGEINLATMSNGRMGVLSGIIGGAHSKHSELGWRAQVSSKRGGDFSAANYGLMNTGVSELNFSLAGGWIEQSKGLEFFFSRFDTEVGIMRAAHIGNVTDLEEAIGRERPFFIRDFSYSIDNPKQVLSHSLLKLKGYRELGDFGRLEIKYGAQWNNRREFDIRRGGRDDRPSIDMSLNTQSLDASIKHHPKRNWVGEFGISSQYQQNRNVAGTGVSPLIPFFNQITGGLFLIERYVKPKFELEFGARYDFRNLEVRTFDAGRNLVNFDLNFQNAVFTLGGQVDLTPHLTFSTNLGSAWRPPHVSELFSNGLHHGVASIERGLFYPGGNLLPNAESVNIQPESSYKWVSQLAFNKKGINLNVNPYLQRINNFIYLVPRPGEYQLTIRGSFPIAEYVQNDAFLYGFDINAGWEFSTQWVLRSSYSIVRAYDRELDQFIIWMPADRINAAVRHQFDGKWKPFLEVGWIYVARQSRVDDALDFAPAPDAYQLVQASMGIKIPGEEHAWSVYMDAENLLNVAYRDYMNRLRYYADDMGRNLSLRIQYTF